MTDLGMTTFDRIVSQGLHDLLTPAALIGLTVELPGIITVLAPSIINRRGPAITRADGAQMRLGLRMGALTGAFDIITQSLTPAGDLIEESHHLINTRRAMEAFYEVIARWAADGLPEEAGR